MGDEGNVKFSGELELAPLDVIETVKLAKAAGSISACSLTDEALDGLLAQLRRKQYKWLGRPMPEANPPAPGISAEGAMPDLATNMPTRTLRDSSGQILYSAAVNSDNDLVAAAVRNGVPLRHVDLSGMTLSNIDFSGKDVRDMRAYRTKFVNCSFSGCDLREACFICAELESCRFCNSFFMNSTIFTHAYVTDCTFTGARLNEAALVGERPIFTMGPLGTKGYGITVFLTDRGIYVRTGCHCSYLPDFVKAVKEKHKRRSKHYVEYMAAVKFIKAYAKTWTPKRKWFGRK